MVITGKKSGERLQDHWSSGYLIFAQLQRIIAMATEETLLQADISGSEDEVRTI